MALTAVFAFLHSVLSTVAQSAVQHYCFNTLRNGQGPTIFPSWGGCTGIGESQAQIPCASSPPQNEASRASVRALLSLMNS
jgi:hypothetical protein